VLSRRHTLRDSTALLVLKIFGHRSTLRLRDVPPDRHSAMTGFPRPLGAVVSLPWR